TQRVFLFDPTSGAALFTLRPPVPDDMDIHNYDFGMSLAVFGDRVVVGAPYDETVADPLGAAYLFDSCGNGVVSAREHCDDGNTVGGDACPATCSYCDEVPSVTCRVAAAREVVARLEGVLRCHARPAAVEVEEQGRHGGSGLRQPADGHKYALCVYDQSQTVAPRVRLDAALDPGAA